MGTDNEAAGHSTKGVWIILLLSTAVSITLNLWHALTMGPDTKLIADACSVSKPLCGRATELASQVTGIHPVLGIIFAIVPPVFAALLSHHLVNPIVGKWIRRAILTLFLVSMLTSIFSQASVMRPYGGGYYAEWAVPIVLDSSALIALHIITKVALLARDTERQATIKAEMDAVRSRVIAEANRDMAAKLDAERRDMSRELAETLEAERRDMAETLEAERRDMAETLEAERRDIKDRYDRDIEAAKRDMEQDIRLQVRAEMAVQARTEKTETTKATSKRTAKADDAPLPSVVPDDKPMTREERLEFARRLLEVDPTMSGSDLGKELRVTARQANRIKAAILGGTSTDEDMDDADEDTMSTPEAA